MLRKTLDDYGRAIRVEIATQIRTCQVGACSERVPASLGAQGVCLVHYLDQAFTRVDSALAGCKLGRLPNAQTVAWLKAQGDFAVKLLAEGGATATLTAEQRSRLLELLLCLATTHECMQKPAVKP